MPIAVALANFGLTDERIGRTPMGARRALKGVGKQIEGGVQKGVGDVEQALDEAHRKAR